MCDYEEPTPYCATAGCLADSIEGNDYCFTCLEVQAERTAKFSREDLLNSVEDSKVRNKDVFEGLRDS